jgi:hypothetical protein
MSTTDKPAGLCALCGHNRAQYHDAEGCHATDETTGKYCVCDAVDRATLQRERYHRVRNERLATAPPSVLASTATECIKAWIGENRGVADVTYPNEVYAGVTHPEASAAFVGRTMRRWAEKGWLADNGFGVNGRHEYVVTPDGHIEFRGEALKLRYISNQMDTEHHTDERPEG